MTWVTFLDRVSFDTYHLAACGAQAVPRPGYNAADDRTVMLAACWTTAWVDVVGAFVAAPNSYLLVQVPDEDVITYGLSVCPNAPSFPLGGPNTILFGGKVRTIFSVARDWDQPKPVTWTDPHDGHVYTVT